MSSKLVYDLSNADYHALKTHLSSTGLRELKRSPAHYQAYLNEEREQTNAMLFGTGFHELIGEPALFGKKYVKAPVGIDRRTKVGKETWEKFQEEHAGKIILSDDDFTHMNGMLKSLLQNKTALHLLTKGKAEVTAFWIDAITGVQCKCRPDYLRDDGIIVDLKTTDDARSHNFQRSIGKFRYDLQSAFYLDGISNILGEPLTDFVHLVVEKTPPYGIAIYTLDNFSLDQARDEIKQLLNLYAECMKKNEWPAYVDEIQNISIPTWMMAG